MWLEQGFPHLFSLVTSWFWQLSIPLAHHFFTFFKPACVSRADFIIIDMFVAVKKGTGRRHACVTAGVQMCEAERSRAISVREASAPEWLFGRATRRAVAQMSIASLYSSLLCFGITASSQSKPNAS